MSTRTDPVAGRARGDTRARAARLAVAGVLGAAIVWALAPRPAPAISAAGPQPALDCAGAPGAAGRHDWRTSRGLPVRVVAPADYQAGRGYGLLVAYPPAGFSPSASERFYGLTPLATGAGWIVAYPQALALSASALARQHDVAGEVARRWCVEPGRVASLGHSDGASMALGLQLRAGSMAPAASASPSWPARRVLASAAGIDDADLARERCPAPHALTLAHDPRDERFPGHGTRVAAWFARCWECAGDAGAVLAGECADLGGCARAGASLTFCHSTDGHARWPRAVQAQLRRWLADAAGTPRADPTPRSPANPSESTRTDRS